MEGSYFTGIDFGIIVDRTWYTWTLYWRQFSKVDKDTEKTEDLELKIQKDAQQQGDDDAEAINFGRGVAVAHLVSKTTSILSFFQ